LGEVGRGAWGVWGVLRTSIHPSGSSSVEKKERARRGGGGGGMIRGERKRKCEGLGRERERERDREIIASHPPCNYLVAYSTVLLFLFSLWGLVVRNALR
jgi:hypothetical protein